MHAVHHRSESDFRATIARGALRARPVVRMASKPRAPRWLVLALLVVDVLTVAAAMLAVVNARSVKAGQRVTFWSCGTLKRATVLQSPVKGSNSGICFVRINDTATSQWVRAESLSLAMPCSGSTGGAL